MPKYRLEFILHAQKATLTIIKNSLSEFGEGLEISDCQDSEAKGKNFKININSEEPTVIFDICSQFGRLRSVKIDEGTL